jgi:hypothetical protein
MYEPRGVFVVENKGKNERLKIQEIRFLSDQPLDADKEREMRFGHLGIVDNLKNIVNICPTPFTIGLFGKWGTGKTTILDALKRKFHASEIAVVIINAWKHEGDALRRTFLQDTINQLQEKQGNKQYLGKEVKLSANLRVPISRTFSSKIANYSLIWPLLLALAVLAGVGVLINVYSPNNLGTYLSTVSGGGLIAGILLWLLQRSVTTETTTITTDRFQDPEEFEHEFKVIINQVSAEKLLVIIDNLDRVSCDKAIELLSTIKTFLEQDKCVFLIACDAEAIKRHLESLYGLESENSVGVSTFDGDEYLRKFFNTYLIIPEFIDTELHTYTEKLLNESNLLTPDRKDVAYVITKAFRDNPRQIKQFINTLVAHLLLAEQREISGELPKNKVTKNVAYLAKDLIIRLQFSEYYNSWTRGELDKSDISELDDFLRATKPIDVDDNRPFRYLKLSEQEIEIPEIRDLQLAFQDNNVDHASQIIERFKVDVVKLSALNRFASSFVNDNRGRGLLLFNIVSSVLTTVKKLGIEFDKHFYHDVAELLNDDGQLGNQLQNFDPNIIFGEVLSSDETQRDELIHRYSKLFEEPNNIKRDDRDTYIKAVLQEFMRHTDWLNKDRRREIRNAIAQNYCNYEILSMFIGKPDEQKKFLHEETLSKFIGEISEGDLEEPERLRGKINLLMELKPVTTDKNLSDIFMQFTSLLKAENAKPDRTEKQVLLTCIEEIVGNYGEQITHLPKDIIDSFAEQILGGVNALAQPGRKGIFMPLCIWLVGVVADPLQSKINAVINSFFAGASSDDLAIVFNKIRGKHDREELVKSYNATLKQRVLSDQSIFDYLYDIAAKDTKTDWLTGLIQVDHKRAINKLEQLNYRVNDKKSVLSAISNKINQLPQIMQRKELYTAFNRMRCANDAGLKGEFGKIIKALLRDDNPDHQNIGLDLLHDATYLSQTQKRDIAIDTIEWLSSLPPATAYQPSAAKSVLLAWSLLTTPPKEKFLYYVFDILVRRGSTTQSIQLGLNIIGQIEPRLKYEDYSGYFDDIFSRAETETDPNIKSLLVNALKSLDPKDLNDQNKSFWQKVRKLSSPG